MAISIFHTISQCREQIYRWRQAGETIALVPTMGNLHKGHLSLVEKAKQLADRVMVSLFVNPLQFGPEEDFACYPRSEAEDLEQLEAVQIDGVFSPQTAEMYPNVSLPTYVEVTKVSDDLCGQVRPGHFRGVATVVTKLLHIVWPDTVLFGEKDWQQCVVIRQMLTALNFPIKMITFPTVRASDGLALSSRNRYLTQEERGVAPQLYKTLEWMVNQWMEKGECQKNIQLIEQEASIRLQSYGFKRVDYLTVRDKETLVAPMPSCEQLVVLGAAVVGKTRLIDNIFFGVKQK